jgi:hypothetical protein
MSKQPLAPPERLAVLWFDLPDGRMTAMRDVPEFMARTVISSMEREGYKFVELGSSQLPDAALAAAPTQPAPEPEVIRCRERLKPGGCQLHNLHCGWPKCNEPAPEGQR